MPFNKKSSAIVKKKHSQNKKKIIRYDGLTKYNKTYTTFVPSTNAPTSRRAIVKLRYGKAETFTVSSGGTTTIQYRMNSIFDPEVAVGGHQPYGHDSLALLYEKYRVFKFGWRISFTSTNQMVHITVVPINGTTSPTFQLGSEMPLATTKTTSYNGGQPAIFKDSIYLPNISGTSSTEYRANDQYEAAFGADPTQNMYLNLIVANPSGSSITNSAAVVLMYWVELHDAKTQTAS